MQGQVKHILEEIKRTGKINFGGEYSFLATDSYVTALHKLYGVGCEIGGTVEGNGFRIKVYPAHDRGYWSFTWMNVNEGVDSINYWTPETICRSEWK